MAVSFKKKSLFSKGIVHCEFFDIATDDLIGYSAYVSNFTVQGSMNNGEVAAGPGSMLVMCIPDTARLNVTAQTADTDLNSLALPVGGTVAGNGIIETVIGVAAISSTLTISNAVAPYGGQNGAIAYVLTSSGSDKATVEAASGTAHAVDENGVIADFTAVSGNTYCVKYFITNSSAEVLSIPALFAPKVVRAHFAVNLYAKEGGSDVMSSSIVGVRHYFFPYYFFTSALNETASQTETGTVDLSGTCLTYEEAIAEGNCTSVGNQLYGYIVDEMIGTNSSTSKVDGLYFVGLGAGVSVVAGNTVTLPIKYSVNGVLTNISDMSQVTFTSGTTTKATIPTHSNVVTGVSAGTSEITATVTNSVTGAVYTAKTTVTVTNT